LGEKKSCKNCNRESVNKQCRSVLCKKCCIASYQKCGVSDHDTSRPTTAKPYLDTLAHSTALSNEETNDNDGESDAVVSSATAADFEHVKTMLEAAIRENRSVFISYLAEKKPAAEEGGKKKRKRKGEQPVLVNTYRKITPKSFDEGVCEQGLKVMADCDLRKGAERGFFLHKIMRIEDHDWKGTWKSQTTSKYFRIHTCFLLYTCYLIHYQ
jgi:hypothetical protein